MNKNSHKRKRWYSDSSAKIGGRSSSKNKRATRLGRILISAGWLKTWKKRPQREQWRQVHEGLPRTGTRRSKPRDASSCPVLSSTLGARTYSPSIRWRIRRWLVRRGWRSSWWCNREVSTLRYRPRHGRETPRAFKMQISARSERRRKRKSVDGGKCFIGASFRSPPPSAWKSSCHRAIPTRR